MNAGTARTIVVRPGVGAAGRIIQRAQLTSHRVAIDVPTLILVQNGEKRISWTSGECTAHAGEAIAIEAGHVVDISNAPGPGGSYSARWISWNEEALDAFIATRASIAPVSVATLLSKLSPDFRAAYDGAFESLLNVDGVPASVANHRSHEVLLWLHEHGVVFRTPRLENLSSRLRRIIQSDPAFAWSVDHAAEQSRCSPATLRRRLTAENVTFRDLLQDARMLHALALLQNTESAVLSVACAVGYDSASRFASRFRSRFGYLPSEVRGLKRGIRGSRTFAKIPILAVDDVAAQSSVRS